jgi:hypothetical protein
MQAAVSGSSFQTAHGFTDDFEVALHGLAQQPVLLELFQRHALRRYLDKVRRAADIFKQLGSARMHRQIGGTG